MTDVTTELAKLTASTTELTNTVVGKYAALDSKVAAAGDSASGAAASVTAAGAHVTSAQQAKAAAEAARVGAETAEANAAAVVTGGTAATLSEAGKIPLANSEGKIDNAWIAGAAKCTKHDFEARRAANNEKFAASGFVHFGKHRDGAVGTVGVDKGLFAKTLSSNVLGMGFSSSISGVSGSSKTDHPVVNVSGVITPIITLSFPDSTGENLIKFPPAEDGTRTYDSATGASVTHATPAIAFASETANNKVVTDRVDMWGFEAYLREVNDADPFVYANGLIQSLAAKISGVTTAEDTVRPITYFAWYEGDESSRGKGVNWQTASEAQRTVIASDPDNNIYFDDETGKFYQWCVRGRSFAGLGNGDWGSIGAQSSALTFDSTIPTYIGSRGGLDVGYEYNPPASSYRFWKSTQTNASPNSDVAVFSNNASPLVSANGECYFLVCGTVNRLNQGAYHPSFNPSGARKWNQALDNGGAVNWYGSDAGDISSTPQAFDIAIGELGRVGAHENTGNIAITQSGRPDGRFYDVIYASGAGGVCRDMRYSAWGLTQEDFAEADLKVKSGEYRGVEKLVRNIPMVYPASSSSSTSTAIVLDPEITLSSKVKIGDRVTILLGSDIILDQVEINGVYGTYVTVLGGSYNRVDGVEYTILLHVKGPSSVAGEYTHTEVIGDPANILQCDDLKKGWVGSWNPTIPDGTSKHYPMTKKLLANVQDYFSDNLGESWSSSRSYGNFDSVKNAWVSNPMGAGEICIRTYKAKSAMTHNAINNVVYQGGNGVGAVFHQAGYNGKAWGSQLLPSFLDKVAVSSVAGTGGSLINLESLLVHLGTGKLYATSIDYTAHFALNKPAPNNDSPALKALNYNVVENQQGFINYAYTELKYDGDWGDDGKIHIADNQTTMLDTNGNIVKVGTARIVEPLGWIRNDK